MASNVDQARPDAAAGPAEPRRSRIGLFLPFVLLGLVVVLWSVAWFWIRGRAADEMDAWLAREAAAGRTWTCADRSITGYPFRLELRCGSLAFARADGRFTLGPLTAVVQVYQPRHGLLQVSGPFHVEQGDLVADATWKDLEASFHGASDGFTRASLVVDDVKGTIAAEGQPPTAFAGDHLEAHARPTPVRFASEGAVDVSLRLTRAVVPPLDALLASTDPLDLALDATIDRAAVLRTGQVARELETWRQAGGRLDIALLSLAKGERRLQASGKIGLDADHRPAGDFDVRAAGLEALVAQAMGPRIGAERGAMVGRLLGQLLSGGRRAPDAAAPPGDAALKPLPPLRLADGRLMLGPFPIPNVTVPALY
ncbi:DUF2125 domain-containing protein [Methylobacterium sp. Leaf466]|uniref:DUF2125 domain-containing protein n=1 Tax=Methylobacterium sp. Leaf466 TaxID=1736386 RepID=UPI0006F81858|nr:DUF2125 domain-containing protein [Methylobacterium sp. Leaf466]KQT77853.1 hypothetical protein ASG59_11030 [Methylobacterium sp. Leaf466]